MKIPITNFRLFTSNRLENLCKALAEVLDKPLASPLDEEIIVVQNKGMERWISMELARHHGICANVGFYFPNSFAHEILRKVVPGVPEASSFDPDVMTWKIMKILPTLIADKGFEEIRNYLGNNRGNFRCFQLAGRIADTFCQYLLFRPEMVFRWEKGEEDHWQAGLWRRLVKGDEGKHRVALFETFIERVEKTSDRTSQKIEGLPERISIFGVSALPGFYMQLFNSISRFAEINLFLMTPCREYGGDISSDQGNSLLASMGICGRDFLDLVNQFDYQPIEDFSAPEEKNLLECIQFDILNFTESRRRSNNKKIVEKNDTSIQIHSCHSPMREMEVLQDSLLAMFEKDPDLKLGEILVMSSDIETYTPYIQSVFDMPLSDPRRIPFNIADRSAQAKSRIVEKYLAILDLPASRFEVSEVLSLLESRRIREKFGLSEKDVELIEQWVNETRIRWGLDGQNRRNLGLPGIEENTWKAGFSRLLLGYAMPGREEQMFSGILPYDHIEGSEAEVLGKFIEFANQIFSSAKSLEQRRTPGEWSDILTAILETFFETEKDTANENTRQEIRLIRRMVSGLRKTSDLSGFDEKIDLNLIKNSLRQKLEKQGFGFGFIPGGVTFSSISSIRGIPFKVICLVGMNSDAYPRESKPPGFDLMAMNPKPGDPSRRNEDRYLFLETLLSARQRLYISYVGQSMRDNSIIPPSVLVSETLDYIEENFEIPGIDILQHIVTKHCLQAFSPVYFKPEELRPGNLNGRLNSDENLFSYSMENLQAAQGIHYDKRTRVPFISRGLKEPENEWKRVNLAELCNFFSNPAKFLINKRLGFSLEQGALIPEEREAFEMQGLEKYLLEQTLMEKRLEGFNLKEFQASTLAAGRLPHGTMGECVFENLTREIEWFAEQTNDYLKGEILEPLEVDFDLSGFRLTGRISSVYSERLIHYRYARVKAKDILRLWIHHLALNSIDTNTLKTGSYPKTSMLAGLKPDSRGESVFAAWEYPPVEESRNILEKLLEKYWQGLVRPLLFFPESSMKYARMVIEKNKPARDALQSAERTWTGSDHKRGESDDLYYQLCFGNTDPLDSDFEKIAIETFGPILQNQKKEMNKPEK